MSQPKKYIELDIDGVLLRIFDGRATAAPISNLDLMADNIMFRSEDYVFTIFRVKELDHIRKTLSSRFDSIKITNLEMSFEDDGDLVTFMLMTS